MNILTCQKPELYLNASCFSVDNEIKIDLETIDVSDSTVVFMRILKNAK